MAKEREYELHLILGSPAICAWKWEIWQQVAGALEKVLKTLKGQPATYSRQLDCSREPNRDVAFGRMNWGSQVHERWTHDSPKTKAVSNGWLFCDSQVWLPSRTICERKKRRPDLYFQVLNATFGIENESPRFGSVVLLGTGRDLPESVRLNAAAAAKSLGEILGAKLYAFKTRPWAIPFGPFAVIDSLNDLDTWLFRVGPRHAEEPTLALLHEPWELGPS